MFRQAVKLYVYPMQQDTFDRYLQKEGAGALSSSATQGFTARALITAKNVQVADHLRNLYAHLLENHYIDCIVGFDRQILGIFSRDVLRLLKEGDPAWEKMVPDKVADAIKARQLFGYTPPPVL